MIRLAITPAAFEAIGETLTLGSVGYEASPNAKGERLIWVEAASSIASTTRPAPYTPTATPRIRLSCEPPWDGSPRQP